MLQRKSHSKTSTQKQPNEDTSRSGQDAVDTREADQVCLFLVMVDLVTSAYIPLDATSSRSTRSRGRGGSTNGARYFPFTYIVRLTMD